MNKEDKDGLFTAILIIVAAFLLSSSFYPKAYLIFIPLIVLVIAFTIPGLFITEKTCIYLLYLSFAVELIAYISGYFNPGLVGSKLLFLCNASLFVGSELTKEKPDMKLEKYIGIPATIFIYALLMPALIYFIVNLRNIFGF